MSLFGSAASAAVGAIGGLAGSWLSGSMSAKAAKDAFERQKELWTFQMQNKHQFEVQDLKDAGLNPILSATNGQAVGTPSVQMSGVPDYGGAAQQGFSALSKALIENVNADTGQKNAKAAAAQAEAAKQNAEANAAKAKQDIAESQERTKLLTTENQFKVQSILADIGVKYGQANAANASAGASAAAAAKYYKDIEVAQHDIAKIDAHKDEILAAAHLTKQQDEYFTMGLEYAKRNPRVYAIGQFLKQSGTGDLVSDIVKLGAKIAR